MINKMAILAAAAYLDDREAKVTYRNELGYTHKYFDVDGAPSHAIWNKKEYILCFNCGHETHCDQDSCTDSVGVGMTDKWQYCGCEDCQCAKCNPPDFGVDMA